MISFAQPYFNEQTLKKILSRFQQVLESGRLTNGRCVREVESLFAELLNGRGVVATNSCTASLHLSMILAGITPRDEVIVPSNTFVSTANAVLYCNAKPVFAEIDPSTLNIDPEDVLNRITEKTRAIVPVHLCGKPCEMDHLMEIAEEHNLTVIEDCAHALGSKYKNQPCGTFGQFACFSFYPTKVIASAEGGLLVSNDKDAITLGRVLINQGRTGTGPNEITEVGYNYRMNELQAAVILEQLPELDGFVKTRNEIAKHYTERLADTDNISLVVETPQERSSFYAYAIRILDISRDAVRQQLLKHGIETSIMYNPVHLQPVYRKLYGYEQGSLPITEKTCSQIINLPMHVGLSLEEVDYVCDTLKNAVKL
ncbi:MAG: DegT/DnrJ/EryC1/StrS family aminotransferase [Candidatus Thorarchaeota archaeon]|nr:MAG: DegT/DnrJ/EryC1/StrS family aminotransferase [Candidatus Thorarchaeota archaeon]